ncbi:glycosyltransferase [Hymenobacter aerilatus]|uniref:Glycosyltransferase n=1 Tax=Hymenobacter aerilatus TaxID=2932251 RepID=A0A8T9SR79_9BACT|nr:glycosyltransferase [Hymenobacter aerilatus]UOR04247.1 glycosyltransferase [Hymenobacter aerilatus]
MASVLPSRFHAACEAAAAPLLSDSSLVVIPPRPELLCSVIIPAKDEAENLPATLAALAAQVDKQGKALSPYSYEVIVLANNCQDATAHVARQMALVYPQLVLHVVERTLPPAEANVGKARRLLMDEASRRLRSVGRQHGIIASTDADTRVTPTWLTDIAGEIAAGADAVGGRILTEASAQRNCPVRRYHLRDAAYRLLAAQLEHLIDPSPADAWPRHHQHFGASFALTVSAYEQVGGLPVVPYLEDEALYQALCYHDLRVRHSPDVRVITSARQEGRVAVGLSWQLREWAALSEQLREPLVASGPQLATQWQARRQLRQLWQTIKADGHITGAVLSPALHAVSGRVASVLGLTKQALRRAIEQAATFGALWQRVQQEQAARRQWVQRWPPVALSVAVAELRALLKQYTPLAAVESTLPA